MGRTLPYLQAAIAAMVLSSIAMGQTAFPDHVVQGETWTDGVHHVAVTQKILSAGDVHEDMLITGTADAEYVSGTSIHLTPDFHAGTFTGNGRFHAYIDQGLGPDGDVVLVEPDPASAVSGNMLHVPQWEKLEIGLQLPQAYRAAIDSFFAHYYADPNDPYVATPGNVDPVHDLNPYADDSLQVVMTLTRPDGTQTMKWGFFMREGKWNGTANTSLPIEDPDDPLYPYHIRFRLAPDMEGPWQFTLSLKAPFTATGPGAGLPQALYTGYAFACDPPLPDNHGPLQVNDANRRTLKFEDGTSFFGLGTNFSLVTGHGNGWWDMDNYRLTRESFTEARDAMEALQSVGGNLVRIFLGNRTFSPEYVHLGVYDRYVESLGCSPGAIPVGTGNYQNNCWAFDRLVNHARTTGTYLQACVKPYPPIIAYETWGWHNDAYLSNFVEPRDPVTNLYDMKRYFYSNGDTASAGTPGSAFYYWKRRYKYILNRWGWSVNIPIIEPFNEIDQMLTYRNVTVEEDCPVNNMFWPADPDLPAIYSQWLTEIISFVKGPQDLTDPVHSPLGCSSKLFLTGTGPDDNNNPNWDQPSNPNWNLPNKNPNVDLVDVHHGMWWGEGELSNSFSNSQAIREAYTNSTTDAKRPFHQGESNYYQLVDIDPSDTVINYYDAALIFDNYDVSFHNELWASTFFGNFAAASTWQKERVFWWEHALPQTYGSNHIPYDYGNQHQTFHSGVLGDTNILQIGPLYADTVSVKNLPVYHNFKPLSDFLNNPNLQAYGLFNDQLHPYKVYDEANKLEAYYLTNADSTLAIGWVHNLNAYWEKHYYVTNVFQDFFGCTPPAMQQLSLPHLQSGLDYHITWFPTRMNDTIHPADAVDTSGTGTVLLDMSTAPLGDTLNRYLDTLRLDYAFVIAIAPVHRSIMAQLPADTVETTDWDFSLYPNPARDGLRVLLPPQGDKQVALYDLTGRMLRQWPVVSGVMLHIPTDELSSGPYCIRVSSGADARTKVFLKE